MKTDENDSAKQAGEAGDSAKQAGEAGDEINQLTDLFEKMSERNPNIKFKKGDIHELAEDMGFEKNITVQNKHSLSFIDWGFIFSLVFFVMRCLNLIDWQWHMTFFPIWGQLVIGLMVVLFKWAFGDLFHGEDDEDNE